MHADHDEGRLDGDEHTERGTRAAAAKLTGDLDALFGDLSGKKRRLSATPSSSPN